MHVGIDGAILLRDSIDHGLRFLRRSRIIEIDQRASVDLARQNREILSDCLNIVHRFCSPIFYNNQPFGNLCNE